MGLVRTIAPLIQVRHDGTHSMRFLSFPAVIVVGSILGQACSFTDLSDFTGGKPTTGDGDGSGASAMDGFGGLGGDPAMGTGATMMGDGDATVGEGGLGGQPNLVVYSKTISCGDMSVDDWGGDAAIDENRFRTGEATAKYWVSWDSTHFYVRLDSPELGMGNSELVFRLYLGDGSDVLGSSLVPPVDGSSANLPFTPRHMLTLTMDGSVGEHWHHMSGWLKNEDLVSGEDYSLSEGEEYLEFCMNRADLGLLGDTIQVNAHLADGSDNGLFSHGLPDRALEDLVINGETEIQEYLEFTPNLAADPVVLPSWYQPCDGGDCPIIEEPEEDL